MGATNGKVADVNIGEQLARFDKQKYFVSNVKGVESVSRAYDNARNFYNQSMRNALAIIELLTKVMDDMAESIAASKKEMDAISNDLLALNSVVVADKRSDVDAANHIRSIAVEFEKINNLKLKAVENFNDTLKNALVETKF
jgi:hypothetical protein